MKGFLTRVGGMLVAPRATLLAALGDEARGGLNDLLVLVALEVLALRMPTLFRLTLFAVDVDVLAGLMMIVNAFTRVLLVPAIATLIGGVLLKAASKRPLFGRRSRRGVKDAGPDSAEPPSAARLGTVDLAALCALPAIVVQIVAAGLQTIFGPIVSSRDMLFVGAAWMAVLLLLAALSLRREAASP